MTVVWNNTSVSVSPHIWNW